MRVAYTACLVDIYFLARLLKNNLNSYVTVAFFGKDHCNAIASFLLYNTIWYNLEYSSEEPDRCVRVRGEIDFNKDLMHYSKLRARQSIPR